MAWARPLYREYIPDPKKPGKKKGKGKPYAYQGIAIHPSGRKSTKVYPLKGQATAWAEEQEAAWRRNRSHDPRAGEMKVGEWIERWLAGRVVSDNTAKKNATSLNRYILPAWKSWPLNAVERPDVGAWIKRMKKDGVGDASIEAAATLFSTIMQAAADAGKVESNVAARQKRPRPTETIEWFYSHVEVGLILAELAEPWRTACALDFRVGLRPGELLGLIVDSVSWERAEIQVVGDLKTPGSKRTVPIPRELLDAMHPLVTGRQGTAPVFEGPGGGPVSVVNFRNRVWYPALDRAGFCPKHRPEAAFNARRMAEQAQERKKQRAAAAKCEHCDPVRWGGPNMMRHTAASHLAMAGVDMYRIERLLGHTSSRMTRRYAKLGRGANDVLLDLWSVFPAPENLGATTVQAAEEPPPPEGGKGL